MRRRFWRKQCLALVLASSMVLSGTALPAGVNYVQAAESDTVFYSKDTEVTTDDLNLPEEDWGDSIPTINYDESIDGIKTTSNFTMTADVVLDEKGYNSLSEAGDYLKVQGVVKLGEGWDWNDSQDIPYLEQKNFEKTDKGYKTAITIEFKDKSADVLKGVYFRIVAKGFEGKVTFSNVKLTGKQEQQITETKEPLTVNDFEADAAGTNAGWEKEAGWQYEKDVTATVEKAYDSNMLKLDLDYTGCEGYAWSEAKIKKTFADGLDVSAYNVLSFDIVYPEAFSGFKTKVFAKDTSSDTIIIEKEGVAEVSDVESGVKKAAVTVAFSPNAAKITELTIGIVGVSTSFKGSVYMDNIVLSQHNASSDFVDITSKPGEGTKADISKMPGEISLADSEASDSAKALYSYLMSLDKSDQVLFGHQNDTFKQVVSGKEGVYSDVKDITGSISGIVGLDTLALTGVESGQKTVDEAIDYCVKVSKDAVAEGAIITLSAHMPNLSNEKITATPDAKRKYDFSQCDFSESKDLSNNCAQEVMPGGKYNVQFTTYLDIIADYAKGLGDIPLLFRPFHENDGGWFWWGSATTNKETYIAMYRYAQDYLKAAGAHNLIYVYSPNGPVQSEEKYLDRYPGDDYIDIIAFDYYDDMAYTDTYGDTFLNSLRSSCEIIKKLADARGKVAAISETGVRVTKADGSTEGLMIKDNPIKGVNWYSKVGNVAKETGMPYYLVWANFSDTNFYVPYKYDDTKGQELVNEFIDFYNEDSSVFANGTNFYDGAVKTQVTNKDQKIKSGYFMNLFANAEIKDAVTLQAGVKNAADVKVVMNDGSTQKEIAAAKAASGYYEANVTKDILDALGKTDIGTVSLVADGETVVTLSNISFGKSKDTLAKNQIENFELYYGDDDYLSGIFTENSAANASSSFVLDKSNKSGGNYGGAFKYKLKTDGAEVWTGRMKGLPESDYSEFNALRMWVKPDGNGQKLVIQLTSNGEDFEAYLTEFVKTKEAKYVTIPFSKMKGKANGTLDAKNITRFAVWCNSIGSVDVDSSIVFDDIEFAKVDEASLKCEEGGYALADSLEDNTVKNPGKTTGLKATKSTTKAITLSWNKADEAEGYQVYRYQSAKKSYVLVKTVKGTTYTDKNLKAGTAYNYKVCAYCTVDGKVIKGADSSILKTATAPAKVTGVKVKKSGKVSWKKVKGASGYEVYFAKNNSKKYKKVATVKSAKKVTYSGKKSRKGTYKVRAYKTVNGKKIKGAFSAGKKKK